MTNYLSLGDLSRTALLRHANVQLKSRLTTLTQEAATGLKADVVAATDGQLGRLAMIQDRLALLQAHQRTGAAVQTELGGLQEAMGALAKIGVAAGGALQAAASAADGAGLGVRAEGARQDFHAAVRLLNLSVGGRHLLSGSAVDTRPLSDPAAILADVRSQVAGLSDPASIAAAVDAWFGADPAADGFAQAHFHGNTAAREAEIAPGETIRQQRTALDPAFRDLLKGLTLGVLAGDASLGLAAEQGAALLGEAGLRVSAAASAMTQARAELGIEEQAVVQALARNGGETTALSLARSDMLAADPYETAAALGQTETNLQNLYALTARLSRLSLADYL